MTPRLARAAHALREFGAAALARCGLLPDAVSLLALLAALAAAGCLLAGASHAAPWGWAPPGARSSWWPVAAAFLLLLSGALDLLDGALARREGSATPRGAFLDSSLDRVADLALHAAVATHLAAQGRPLLVLLTVLAFAHGMLIAYLRARAEALGPHPASGFWQRGERFALLIAACATGHVPQAMIVLGLLPAFTAWRRFRQVWRLLSGVPEERADAPLAVMPARLLPWRAPRGSLPWLATALVLLALPAILAQPPASRALASWDRQAIEWLR